MDTNGKRTPAAAIKHPIWHLPLMGSNALVTLCLPAHTITMHRNSHSFRKRCLWSSSPVYFVVLSMVFSLCCWSCYSLLSEYEYCCIYNYYIEVVPMENYSLMLDTVCVSDTMKSLNYIIQSTFLISLPIGIVIDYHGIYSQKNHSVIDMCID